MPSPAPTDCLAGCAIAAAAAAGLGALLRSCGLRRAWIVAGLAVGLLLGVQGLGRVDARLFERFYSGAGPQRHEAFVAARAIELAAMAGLPQGATLDDEDLAQLEAERRSAELRFERTRREFDASAAWVVATLAAFVLMGASPMVGRMAWWRDGGAPVGAWCVVAPASLMVIALAFSREPDPELWWMAALAIACLGAPALLARDRWTAVRLLGDRAVAIDAARGMNGAIACTLAIVAWIVAGPDSAAWLLPWCAALAAWGLRAPPAGMHRALAGPAVAAAVAIGASRVDPLADWQPWIALAALFAEDLKWAGGAVGLAVWGRMPWFASLRACMPLAETGPAQAVLAALALLTDAVPAWVGFALLISAAAVEVMAPFRRGTALRLDEAIQESRQAR